MEQFNAYVEDNAERFIKELKEFCRQPSIFTQAAERGNEEQVNEELAGA